MKHKGIICGILAAVCYGTNPFGALPLYEGGSEYLLRPLLSLFNGGADVGGAVAHRA
jgi:hypothetical protein